MSAGTQAKCKMDARIYQPEWTLDVATSYTENPLVIKEVLQVLAKRWSDPKIHNHICPDCLVTEIQECIDRNSNQRSELTDDQLHYGDQW